ncbi:---NA--- : Thioredoxin domain protein OS=Planctomyces limnophilus (strain ATCC 43296 / DSM 3776 / IFAM 1008 / 290) GN=Plim_3801 PE=4 SV=1: Trypsin_2 [Gemmataceae bacterium]|nr:---NA--- : Thioredoxin domain protein OS=Planctomyces limnophilus (strain ATCC 43296 / DSM 3776 / IFAM 1008 / 290) GN=Plim_3801 PE=4 SV=1: Trypsin_2 [Gemmataceae bacterium]VTU02768.1 ---NA--- : Thioredoxin domain protein OS=Planctomyces limnophilus (strain ATCC 43296 / DSM 3776 / IFAM 1008 / 290) GN=Plim_3801 PE=4 SV=1: Trypsin_2 [Gemmataceae bacterium]
MRLFTAAALVAHLTLAAAIAAVPSVEAFTPTKTPVSPTGVRAATDMPAAIHMRNTGGIGKRGVPGTGAGLCVYTAVEMDALSQCVPALKGFQQWMTNKPGGGSPAKLAAMIAQFCREKGVREPQYVQHTGGDERFLDMAMRTRRPIAITYAGGDDFYGGLVDHMVCLVHLDSQWACIVDNNRPGVFVWMTRAELIARWKARGGGWAVVLLDPPAPPAPVIVTLDEFGVWRPEEHQYTFPSCPNGRCPNAGAAPVVVQPRPAAVGTPRVGRSACAIQVQRDAGDGITEYGSGTVIASERGRSLVLTNSHVVPDGTRPVSVWIGTKKHAARHLASSVMSSDTPDLALLVIDVAAVAAPIAATPAPVGAAVYQWGFGGVTPGSPAKLKSGATVEQGNYVGPKTLRTTIASQQGDSGSGLFSDSGELVGVAWGGDGKHQFANSLDAVKAWVRDQAGEQFGALAPVKAAEAVPKHAVPNYGIDTDELDGLTIGGKQRYWVRGHETLPGETYETMGGALVDDSDCYHLSVLGGAAEQQVLDQVLADPRVARFRDRLHARVYARDSWLAKERVASAVQLQEPAPKGGAVVGKLDRVDVELLVALLLQVFDPKPPTPPAKPADPASPAKPADAPNETPATPPAEPARTPWLAIAALLVILFLRNRKESK